MLAKARRSQLSRWFVWSSAAALALAVLLPPLLDDRVCIIEAWQDHPYFLDRVSARDRILGSYRRQPAAVSIGFHFGLTFTTAAMAGVFLDPHGRFDSAVLLHRWALRYTFAIGLDAAFLVTALWLFSTCPENIAALYAMCLLAASGTYVVAQLILCYLALLRLRMVAHPAAARRATLYFRAGVVFSLLCAILAPIEVLFPFAMFTLLEAAVFGITVIVFTAFQAQAFVSFFRSASEAKEEVYESGEVSIGMAAVRRAQVTAACAAASGVTVALFIVTYTLHEFSRSLVTSWCVEVTSLLNSVANAGLNLFCSGLVGPTGDRMAELCRLRSLVEQARQRRIRAKLVEAAKALTGPALALAGLFEGVEPDILIDRAVARFRCISWDVLSANPSLILGGGPLDGAAAATELYNLSQPCRLAECDAFLSHSWHDNAQLKWEMLCRWCDEFKRTQLRSPTLWLDKVCIDQENIKDDLQCLPVYLAGCNTLLVASGATYTSRLWCCTELFVYMNMMPEDEPTQAPAIFVLSRDEKEKRAICTSWRSFDAASCKCCSEADKERIFAVIERYPGGVAAFNEHVQGLAQELFEVEASEVWAQDEDEDVRSI